jgi:diguanylate cyclase (GGDEF)-like protein
MTTAGTELRRARRLIAICVAALCVAGVGLVVTARDVATWIDGRDSEIETARVTAAVEHLRDIWPQITPEQAAMRVAKGFHLRNARVSTAQPEAGELAVSLGEPGTLLVWTAPALGQEARERFAPTRLPLILGSVIAVAFMLYKLGKLAVALDRERLRAGDLARRDPLTGLGNRLAFDEELARRIGGRSGFAVFCLDLNGFKAVNDIHGHAAGDAVLCGVAVRLRRLLGPLDAPFRLGGDEFAIVVADDGRNLPRLARKIVLAVDDSYTVGRGAEAVVGACVGAAISPQDGSNARELVEAADAALYRAKAASGSCSRFAADEDPSHLAAHVPVATAA